MSILPVASRPIKCLWQLAWRLSAPCVMCASICSPPPGVHVPEQRGNSCARQAPTRQRSPLAAPHSHEEGPAQARAHLQLPLGLVMPCPVQSLNAACPICNCRTNVSCYRPLQHGQFHNKHLNLDIVCNNAAGCRTWPDRWLTLDNRALWTLHTRLTARWWRTPAAACGSARCS